MSETMNIPQLFQMLVESIRVSANIAEELGRLFTGEILADGGADRERPVPVLRGPRGPYKQRRKRRDAVARFVHGRRVYKRRAPGYGGKAAREERREARRTLLRKLPKRFTKEDVTKVLKLRHYDRARWLGVSKNAGMIKTVKPGVWEATV